VLDSSPRAANLPRELARSVLPAHYLQPGDIVVVEPVRLDSDVRLPADQRIMADGTIDLGGYGRVIVAGLTIEDAERLVEQRIIDAGGERTQINVRLIEPQQVYYVLGEVNSPGSFPLVGSETVLDAILAAGGLTGRASPCDAMLVRPTPPPSCRVTLPICYRAITQLGDTTTNYQLQPGDRVFVATRTFCEDIAFWRARQTCDRCNKVQCPCPSPQLSMYQNPISEYLPAGPVPVEFQGDAEPTADRSTAAESLPAPTRRAPQPSTVRPAAPTQPVQPVQPRQAAPAPARPDPFAGDEFFEGPR
jgi:polysaccharide biosynthesis/export protein